MLTPYKRGQGDAEISDETTPTKRLLVGLVRQGRSEGVEFSSLVWVLMRPRSESLDDFEMTDATTWSDTSENICYGAVGQLSVAV